MLQDSTAEILLNTLFEIKRSMNGLIEKVLIFLEKAFSGRSGPVQHVIDFYSVRIDQNSVSCLSFQPSHGDWNMCDRKSIFSCSKRKVKLSLFGSKTYFLWYAQVAWSIFWSLRKKYSDIQITVRIGLQPVALMSMRFLQLLIFIFKSDYKFVLRQFKNEFWRGSSETVLYFQTEKTTKTHGAKVRKTRNSSFKVLKMFRLQIRLQVLDKDSVETYLSCLLAYLFPIRPYPKVRLKQIFHKEIFWSRAMINCIRKYICQVHERY